MKKMILCFAMVMPALGFSQSKPKFVINHAALFVTDLKRTGEFYSHVLNLDSIPEPFHDGRHIWYSLGMGNMALHIIQGADKSKEYFQNNHLCFRTDDVIGFSKVLQERNIPWVDAKGNPYKITNRVDGVHQLFLQDPDGYWIEVNDAK